MSIHIATKGLCRSPPWAKKFLGKNSQGCRRLLKVPKASWGPRKVPGAQWAQGGSGDEREWGGWGGAREARPLSLTEDPRLPKAAEGLQSLPRLPEAPGRSQAPRETQGGSGASGGKREQEKVRGWGGARKALFLSMTEDPRLPKAYEGSWGFLRPQEGSRDPGRHREAQGVRRSEREWGGWGGAREARPLSLTEDPRQRLPKACSPHSPITSLAPSHSQWSN